VDLETANSRLVDFDRPVFGVAGESTGYLFAPGDGRELVGFGSYEFSVRIMDRKLANDVILANHYSGTYYRGTTTHLGVFMGDRLVGVIQYGYALNPARAGSVVTGTAMNEYLELNRMWLSDEAPRNSESRALAASIRLIRRLRPAVKWIQSFADERCGLNGTVYQAAGFTYHGEHKTTFLELDGEFFHPLLLTKTAGHHQPKPQRLLAGLDRVQRHTYRQFRYLRFLQNRFAKHCRHPVRPFPKPDYAACPVDERGTTPCEQGATP
jgi:hypothetical protein